MKYHVMALRLNVAFLMWLGTNSSSLAFTPSTLFTLEVQSVVTYVKLDRSFRYTYNVYNSSGSSQDVGYFGVYVGETDLSNIGSPNGWRSALGVQGQPVVLWAVNTIVSPPIVPGVTVRGFSFSSPRMPAMQAWYARSTYNYFPATPEEENQIVTRRLDSFFNNSQHGSISGPGAQPPSDPSQAISNLISLQQKAFHGGWFRKHGILNSLEAKLLGAQKSIMQGQPKTAMNQLNAYSNEVSAQKGKDLGYTTADLFLATASFIADLIAR